MHVHVMNINTQFCFEFQCGKVHYHLDMLNTYDLTTFKM